MVVGPDFTRGAEPEHFDEIDALLGGDAFDHLTRSSWSTGYAAMAICGSSLPNLGKVSSPATRRFHRCEPRKDGPASTRLPSFRDFRTPPLR